MTPLSAFTAGLGALAGTSKKSSYSDPSSEPDAGQDQFARMLNPVDTPPQAPPQAPERIPAKQSAPKPTQSGQNRSDDDTHDDVAGDTAAQPRARDGDAAPAKSGRTKDTPAPETSTADAASKTSKSAKTATTTTEDATVEVPACADAGWPPPGLGGFGMGLLTQALPGSDVLAAAAAALTASIAGATGAAPTATAMPTDVAAATATVNANAGTVLPPLGALIPVAAAGPKAASTTAVSGDAQTATLMSMAAKALPPVADDSAAPTAPDAPAFVLPTATAPALNRLQDPAPIFSASPTPTPEVGSDNFDDAIGARLSWLADQKIGHAHIKVTPNEMGPVEVRLHLDGDKVNASFTAANAETRQALEQSLPRLRDMLGQNGFQLGQADVGQQQRNASGNRQGGNDNDNGNDSGLTLEGGPAVGIPSVLSRQRGLLDAYA